MAKKQRHTRIPAPEGIIEAYIYDDEIFEKAEKFIHGGLEVAAKIEENDPSERREARMFVAQMMAQDPLEMAEKYDHMRRIGMLD